jgi:ketosteroid isomerase-like protein
VSRRLVSLIVVLCAGLAACGGDDSKDAEQTVRDFLEATNTRDVDAICGRLLTQDFLERNTGGVGEGAQRACRAQLKAGQVVEARLVRLREPRVDGDRATVTAVLASQGRQRTRTFRLVREDGDWKIAGARGE